MIGKVFALNDLTARDLMTSRVATPSLAGDASLESVQQEILEAPEDAWWVVLGLEVDEVLGIKRGDTGNLFSMKGDTRRAKRQAVQAYLSALNYSSATLG